MTNLERNVKPTLITGLTATAQLVSANPGFLIKLIGYNANTPTMVFLQVFDAAAVSDVTVGTTVPKYVVPFITTVIDDNVFGIEFDKGVVVAATTTATGSGAGSITSLTAVYRG